MKHFYKPPVVSQEDQTALIQEYHHPLNLFAQKSTDWLKTPEIVEYLNFKTDQIPEIKNWGQKYVVYKYAQYLSDVFAPLDHWTAIEDRWMRMLAMNWKVCATCFFKWYVRQTKEGNEPSYEAILATLKKYGIEEDIFPLSLQHLFSYLIQEGIPTKFAKVVLEKFKANLCTSICGSTIRRRWHALSFVVLFF